MLKAMLIINYNDSATTLKLLENIKGYSVLDKIVIVDNFSSDSSYSELKKMEIDNVDVIQSHQNNGYGAGINFGCKYIEKQIGDCLIAVCNPDIEISSEDNLNTLFDSVGEYSVIAPIIKEHNGISLGWKQPTPFQDAILNIVFIHKFLRNFFLDYGKEINEDQIREVDIVSGCFFIIKSKDLRDVNYFDENIFLYYEENVLSAKLHKLSRKIGIVPYISVFHNHSVSIDKSISKLKKIKILKNSQFYFHKKYSNANKLELISLKLTALFSYFILFIFYKIQDLFLKLKRN